MYGKLFAQMYDGTLATKGPWQALITFQQLIILADQDGVVDMTPEAIARRTTIPLRHILTGIQALEQPDEESRTPAADGRRITRISDTRDWGWQIVNYEHYRKLRTADERREYHRQYDKRYWQKTPGLALAIQQDAQRQVRDAINRGDLKQAPCEECDEPETEAHHDDYSFPLQVRWLCKSHHKKWHRENGQGALTQPNIVQQSNIAQPKSTNSISSKQEAEAITPQTPKNGGRLRAGELLKAVRGERSPQFPNSLQAGWQELFNAGEMRVIQAVGLERILSTQPANDGPLLAQVASMLAEVA